MGLGLQEQIMIWFQGIFENFHGFCDKFFLFWTFLGEELIIILVLPIIYWIFNKRLAKLLAATALFSMTINGVIKDIAQIQRPIGNENIRFVEVDNFLVDTKSLKNDSYSFPSGHAQNVSTFLFILSFYFKNKKVWRYSIIVLLLVMMSRMYLGVHWPIDVIVGALLGLICAYIGYNVYQKIDEDKELIVYLIISVIAIGLLIFASKSDTFKAVGALLGFAMGAIFERKKVNFNPTDGSIKRKIIRVLVGVIILVIFKEGLKQLFLLIGDYVMLDLLRYLITVFVGIGLYPYLFTKLKW